MDQANPFELTMRSIYPRAIYPSFTVYCFGIATITFLQARSILNGISLCIKWIQCLLIHTLASSSYPLVFCDWHHKKVMFILCDGNFAIRFSAFRTFHNTLHWWCVVVQKFSIFYNLLLHILVLSKVRSVFWVFFLFLYISLFIIYIKKYIKIYIFCYTIKLG